MLLKRISGNNMSYNYDCDGVEDLVRLIKIHEIILKKKND